MQTGGQRRQTPSQLVLTSEADQVHPNCRIIPARAGNALTEPDYVVYDPDHPRAGGERAFSDERRRRAAGSSPRGRGTHGAKAGFPEHTRIIPARAGNANT